MRPEKPVTQIEIDNAKSRARWAELYYSGTIVPDYRSEEERTMYHSWYDDRLDYAKKYLKDRHDQDQSVEERPRVAEASRKA